MITLDTPTPFGPTGKVVYERTYSRVKPSGERETWPETVERVATGNLSLVHGAPETWSPEVRAEHNRLTYFMKKMAILPAGRHLWASGVKGRQYLFNCHVSGWGERLSEHFEFTFLRLMEGGGVGANYSLRFLEPFGPPRRPLNVHIVCDPMHQDYVDMKAAGLLSEAYNSDWAGAFEVEDSREGWAAALVDLIDTFMTDEDVRHANRVYDISRVRCKGSRLKTFGGTASGPAPFAKMMHEVGRILSYKAETSDIYEREHVSPIEAMEIDHAIAECVVSGGVRRSARMAIVHWKDPYIGEFLECKRDSGKHWTTNISVEIDDDFIQDLLAGRDPAKQVHRWVVEGMLINGEPGYWNSSLSNEGEIGEVIATNPCGEIALQEWENCNLGHVNLDAFAPTHKGGPVDILGLAEAHQLVTRFLIRATYGDVNDGKQAARLATNRRIGVGHLGVQGYFAKRGVRYSDVPTTKEARKDLEWLHKIVRDEARSYAFKLRVPEPVKVTTVAPTGTIAKLPGVSEGIHPIYARYFIRRVRFSVTDADQRAQLAEFASQGFALEQCMYDQSGNTVVVEFPTKDSLVEQVEALGYDSREAAELVQSADEIPLDDMLAFQAMYQECWADNAVSFTANIRPGQDPDDVSRVIQRWLPKLKGTTIMVDGSRPQAPYQRISKGVYQLHKAVVVSDGIDDECASGACPVR